MLEFEFEVLSGEQIHLRYVYGGEWFTFNLFRQQEAWIIHPFDGILIGNKEMCRLVLTELFANKPFQVALAKEGIRLSTIRTSIDLATEEEEPAFEAMEDRTTDTRPASLEAFIREHSMEEVIQFETSLLAKRAQAYLDILQRMFMEGMEPTHPEFIAVQKIVRIFDEASGRLEQLNDSDAPPTNPKRW